MIAKRLSTPALLLAAGMLAGPPQAQALHHHTEPHWTYDEQKKWALLVDPTFSPRFPFAECNVGQKQSPVNIEVHNVVSTDDLDELEAHYVDNPLSLTNNGHTIRVNTEKGSLRIGKNSYDLLQFHFHAPSEHHMNGIAYPLEIHFVNGTVDGRVAVIGVFVQKGEHNETFQKILDASPAKTGTTVDIPSTLNPAQLLPRDLKHFYTYAGSLTTPPCTEGIQWYLFGEPVQASQKQIDEFSKKYFHDNARGEQRLNGRHVLAH